MKKPRNEANQQPALHDITQCTSLEGRQTKFITVGYLCKVALQIFTV